MVGGRPRGDIRGKQDGNVRTRGGGGFVSASGFEGTSGERRPLCVIQNTNWGILKMSFLRC